MGSNIKTPICNMNASAASHNYQLTCRIVMYALRLQTYLDCIRYPPTCIMRVIIYFRPSLHTILSA